MRFFHEITDTVSVVRLNAIWNISSHTKNILKSWLRCFTESRFPANWVHFSTSHYFFFCKPTEIVFPSLNARFPRACREPKLFLLITLKLFHRADNVHLDLPIDIKSLQVADDMHRDSPVHITILETPDEVHRGLPIEVLRYNQAGCCYDFASVTRVHRQGSTHKSVDYPTL